MNWYERWFGQEYLLVYEHRDIREAGREIEAVRSLLNLTENDLVLYLCCGPGRHDSPLARMGCRVIGLDYSMELLKLAREGIQPGSPYPVYVRADARKIPFRDEAFDVVLNLFTSFGYFSDEENRGFIRSIARLLKPGGRYYIDYLNPRRVKNNLAEESTRERDGITITEKRRIDPFSRRIEKTILLRLEDHVQMFYESVRLYEKEEMLAILETAGLGVEPILGASSGEPFGPESERMIFYGKKQNLRQDNRIKAG